MQKNHTCKTLAIGIIILFIGVGIHPVFAVESKTSNGSSELIISKSYISRSWQRHYYYIIFSIKNVGEETFDGYISTHGEMRPLFKPSEIFAEASGSFKDITLKPGDKIIHGMFGFHLVYKHPVIGFYIIRYDIFPHVGNDTSYGNKVTEIVFMWSYFYVPIYRYYR